MDSHLLRRTPPWYIWLPPVLAASGVAVPIAYLFVRGFDAEWPALRSLLFHERNAGYLLNTMTLVAGVVGGATVLALPAAWLTARTDLLGKRFFVVAFVAPLAIPNYILAYVLRGLGGDGGVSDTLLGWRLPPLSGYFGAWLALTVHFTPYLYLNLRAAMLRLDPALSEAAASLGCGGLRRTYRVLVPQLLPGFLAGALIIALAVVGDFGVVSLMRFETFSFVLYEQYHGAADRVYAAWLAVALLGLAAVFLLLDGWILRRLRLTRGGKLTTPRRQPTRLGRWQWPALMFFAGVLTLALVLPLGTLGYWLTTLDWPAWWGTTPAAGEWWQQAPSPGSWEELRDATFDSLKIALPAAFYAALLALPVAYLACRYPAPWTRWIERSAYLGYAVPCLAFGLGLIFFTLRVYAPLYQTFFLVVAALSLHYLAEAVGPIRARLYIASRRLEEAAESLGCSPWRSFWRVTFPLLRGGVTVSLALVFISSMKELPLSWLLRPTGVDTLAIHAWSHADNAEFAAAAPYALTIVCLSALLLAILLWSRRREEA